MTFETEQEPVVWADVFPMLTFFSTRDPRVFVTRLEKVRIDSDEKNPIFPMGKTKKYFCCVVGKSCYGVEVIRKNAVDAKEEYEQALQKVIDAADYYEKNEKWPSDTSQ